MATARSSSTIAAIATCAVSKQVRWLAALGVLVCAITVPAVAARAELPQWYGCLNEKQSTETVEKYAKLLSPAEGATVVAGAPVTFFARGGGESPMTFMVASSPALLSSPDIDSGLATLLPPGYKPESLPPESDAEDWLTSTKATVTPRTIYWTASFTRNLRSCDEPPVTFTLPPRTLTVVPSPTEEQAAAKKKQEEEAAANKKKEEEAACSVSLASQRITTQGFSAATIQLTGTGAGAATCIGKLTLTGKGTPKKEKKGNGKTETIGTATFSIPAGKTTTVKLDLNAIGRALLAAHHGRLSTTLTILKSSPVPSQTHIENVNLVQQKTHGRTKK
jgi:hypothetical protein